MNTRNPELWESYKTLIWFVLALIGTYEEGLSIGSFLSQWLCNYVISYAYHFATERLYKTRRGKRQNLVTHILVFMDDIIIFAASKHNAKAAGKALEEFMLVRLGLCIKPNRCIKQTAKEPPDMMGYVVSKEHTTIRARTFVRARRALLRAWWRMCAGLPIYLQNARRIVSYRGYFKHTNSNRIAKALHLKAVHRAARKVISKFAKGANKDGKWYLKQEKQDKDIAHIKEEDTLIVFALSACLDGLQQLGANHTVPIAKDKLDKYINQQAHK